MRYAKPTNSVSTGGGNRAKSGVKYRGAVPSKTQHRAFTSGDTGYGSALCKSCGYVVGLDKHGTFRGHRVGLSMRDSWPCPGKGQHPDDADEVTAA